MFESVAAALKAFEEFTTEALRDVIVSLMLPTTALVPTDTPSLTYVGGEPTMNPAITWPVPPLPDDLDAFVNRGGETHADSLRGSLLAHTPYAFIAQVDLSSFVSAELPNTGRLLFFYDIDTGPWDNSARSARVIWDQSPADQTQTFARPQGLIDAQARYAETLKAYVPDMTLDEATIKILRDSGMTDADIKDFQNTMSNMPETLEEEDFYFGLKAYLKPAEHLLTPVPSNLEWDAFTAQIIAKHGKGLTPETIEEAYYEGSIEYDYAAPFQLLGLPAPVQGDPRLDAAVPLLYGQQYLSSDDWQNNIDEITDKAHDLRLLFQADLNEWYAAGGEGTVYFLITDADLATRNFDNVIAVYQQT